MTKREYVIKKKNGKKFKGILLTKTEVAILLKFDEITNIKSIELVEE